MRRRTPGLALLVLFLFPLGGIGIQATDSFAEPARFFREFVGLNDDQIREIREGRAVAKILDAPTTDQVFVFGLVYIHSTPERYLKFASDIGALRKLPSYLELRKFSDPPQLADLAGFTLDDEDFKQLKNYKPAHCEVQLPAEAIEEFQRSVNWSAPDAADQANHLAQQMALQALLNYQQGGNAALGTYRDKNHPAVVADTFAALLSRSKALPVYLPEFARAKRGRTPGQTAPRAIIVIMVRDGATGVLFALLLSAEPCARLQTGIPWKPLLTQAISHRFVLMHDSAGRSKRL